MRRKALRIHERKPFAVTEFWFPLAHLARMAGRRISSSSAASSITRPSGGRLAVIRDVSNKRLDNLINVLALAEPSSQWRIYGSRMLAMQY